MEPLDRPASLRARYPRLFAVSEWRDLYKDRRRTCPECGSYVWLELDRSRRPVVACSQCSWEDDL